MKIVSKLLITLFVVGAFIGTDVNGNVFRAALQRVKATGAQIVQRAKTAYQNKITQRIATGTVFVGVGLVGGMPKKHDKTASVQNTPQATGQPVTYLFAHGVDATHTQAQTFKHYNLIGVNGNPVKSFNFPEVANRAESNLAQDGDIACLASQHAQIKGKAVLVGFSRGASAMLSFAGQHKPANVQGIVALSPFDHGQSVIQNWTKFGSLSWFTHKLGALGLLFKKYNPDGIQPTDVVEQIPQDVPILLGATLQDGVVPAWSTMRLYEKLHKQGRKNVHIAVLENGGSHVEVPGDRCFHQIAHAFARQYDMPYSQALADAGQKRFEQSQPDPATLSKHQPWGWTLDGIVAAGIAAAVAYAKSGK